MVLGILKRALHLWDQMFLCENLWKLLIVCSTLNAEPIVSKRKTFFKKLEYRLSIESTKIENVSFWYKTALSGANVKTNSMVSTKWTYKKEWSFASNYFISLTFFFLFKNLLWRVDFMYQQHKCLYLYFL